MALEFAKTALVTGGSGGIGQGIAIVLAEHGYDVAIAYRDREEGAKETCREIEKLGQRAFMYRQDMGEADCDKVVGKAIADLGHLTLMVNNAGISQRHSVLTIKSEEIDFLVNVNFRAYLLCAGAAARHMVKRGIPGNIIFITSTRGERAYAADLLYGGLKAGIKRACESIALDLAPYGIRCNCVAPGGTQVRDPNRVSGHPFADAIPLGRMGTPRDNGEAVAFLASGKASYITGVTLKVDGGLVLPGMIEGSREHPELIHYQTEPDWFARVKADLENFEEKW